MDQFLRSVGWSMAFSGPWIHGIFNNLVDISVNTNSAARQRRHHSAMPQETADRVARPEPCMHLAGNSMKSAPEPQSRFQALSTALSAPIACQRRTRRARNGAVHG
jgi:hypothetical protein